MDLILYLPVFLNPRFHYLAARIHLLLGEIYRDCIALQPFKQRLWSANTQSVVKQP